MDYHTEAHSVTANAAYQIMPKWNVTTDFNWTMGRGNINDLNFNSMYPTGDAKLDAYNMSTAGQSLIQPILYDVAYVNGIDKYSNLDYQQYDLSVGTSYIFDYGVGVGVNYYFTHFDDAAAYVYGDEGNTVQMLMGFMTYSF